MDAQMEARMKAEHAAKYRALLARVGPQAIRELVEPLAARARAALDCGDEHLNGIPLHVWDRLALGPEPQRPPPCPHCGHRPSVDALRSSPSLGAADWPYRELRATARTGPWSKAPGLSLAERVCLLKYAARLLALGAWKD